MAPRRDQAGGLDQVPMSLKRSRYSRLSFLLMAICVLSMIASGPHFFRLDLADPVIMAHESDLRQTGRSTQLLQETKKDEDLSSWDRGHGGSSSVDQEKEAAAGSQQSVARPSREEEAREKDEGRGKGDKSESLEDDRRGVRAKDKARTWTKDKSKNGRRQVRRKGEADEEEDLSWIPADVLASWEGLSPLDRRARLAWLKGARQLVEVDNEIANLASQKDDGKKGEVEEEIKCPVSVVKKTEEIKANDGIIYMSCGLTVGSVITVIGQPSKMWEDHKGFSFHLEILGLRSNEEDPPRIYHMNPRLTGDWSGKPVIEQNTQYRGQWGIAQRCEGWHSREDEVTVDGYPRCERWSRDSPTAAGELQSSGWLKRLINGGGGKEAVEWPFPFIDGQPFVLTLRAGWEGFHVSVDGHHITSFPFRPGYIIEEGTGFSIGGDVEVWEVFATALPSAPPVSHPGLEVAEKLKAPALESSNVTMFIGVLSSSNHFAERLAVRKTWMQSPAIRQGLVAVRFFVAMHPDTSVNVDVRREADAYGDMVILPYADHYDIIVLKTIAIMTYGVRTVTAKYVMKCDDDTFVRVDRILQEVHNTGYETGLYMGNINEYHRPLREGKWAVTEQEWPEATYPPYADGPGYIVTSDIANFVAEQNEQNQTRLFKMEDVCMGMWVVQHGLRNTIHYTHSWRFCQWGCVEDYLTAHYQSPRQMLCMWAKLQSGRPACCNQRKLLKYQ